MVPAAEGVTGPDGGPNALELQEAEAELERARAARQAGNEGRARVCARRAAGRALQAYYRQLSGSAWVGDALAQLNRLKADEAMPPALRARAARLTTVVDFHHRLPFPEDPLADAREIVAHVAAVMPAADDESET